MHALKYSFGSLDSVIGATVAVARKEKETATMTMITADKGFKAGLKMCLIPVWDAFSKRTD